MPLLVLLVPSAAAAAVALAIVALFVADGASRCCHAAADGAPLVFRCSDAGAASGALLPR
jgi:hypothetical protein